MKRKGRPRVGSRKEAEEKGKCQVVRKEIFEKVSGVEFDNSGSSLEGEGRVARQLGGPGGAQKK